MRWNPYLILILMAGLWIAPASLTALEEKAGPPSPAGPVVYVIPFEGEVEKGLYNILRRGFDEAEEARATYILLEMNTPGGRVDAALDIVDLILESKIPVAIFVKGGATSAGAIISLAAEKVYMSESSTIGTAAPVMLGGGEDDTMESKALSYVLAQVRRICESRGYSEFKTQLAQAMVDKDMEIPDPAHPGRFISEKGKLLTLTAREALQYQFINGLANSREEALEQMDLTRAEILFRPEFLSEQLARFFSSTIVSSLLLTIAFIGIYLEFQAPGFGLPGVVGILALILFFWGHTIAGLAGWEGPLLFLLGMLLVAVELFVIPGFGFTGILGLLCLFASIVITLMNQPVHSPHFLPTFSWDNFTRALFITVMTMIAGVTIAMAIPFVLPIAGKTQFGSWMFLHFKEDRQRGFQSAPPSLERLAGKRGIARSTLRPAGIAEIEGQRVDVVSEGGYISPNTPVRVVKVEGRRVVVKPE
ncbi:MAG: nodulation protein NfeD [Candidatus Omnitrophica bacterium]|nr:nodulation protein NfeD [Candidatus Omnitrophota bacterium]